MLKIKWVRAKKGVDMYFPISFQRKYKLFSDKMDVHFGSWNKRLKVKFKKNVPNNTICLSENLKNNLLIQEDLSYEFKIRQQTMHIGPVILWGAANTNERLTARYRPPLLYGDAGTA